MLTQRIRSMAMASFAVASIFWVYLLAVQPIYTAALNRSAPLFDWLSGCWAATDDMGHGPFIPFVSLYVLFLRRKAIMESLEGPDWKGLLAILAGVFLFWVGFKMEEVRFCLAAFVVWVWAVPFALWGSKVAAQFVFPAGYLLLSIPRWDLVANFTVKLRVLAAAVAVGIANGVGIATERVGTGIHSAAGNGFNLDVAEACSGLRSIFAMTALAAAYAFFTQKTLLRKWALFLCAVPVAIAGNVARIVTITIIAAWFGEETATGFYHDYSGYIVFLVGILLLVELGRLSAGWQVPKWIAKRASARPSTPPPIRHDQPGIGSPLWLILAPAFLLSCILMVRLEPPVVLAPVDFLPAKLPVELGPWRGSPVWFCHNEQCLSSFHEDELKAKGVVPFPEVSSNAPSTEPWVALRDLKPRYRCPSCETGELYGAALGEQRLLSGDACILRSRYTGDGPAGFTVTVIISGINRNSIHNPQLCLPAQGYMMDRISTVKVSGKESSASIKMVELSRGNGLTSPKSRLSFAYWFFTKNRQTSSVVVKMIWSAWARAFHHRAERWVMVTVLSERGKAEGASEEKELLAFSGILLDELRDNDVVHISSGN